MFKCDGLIGNGDFESGGFRFGESALEPVRAMKLIFECPGFFPPFKGDQKVSRWNTIPCGKGVEFKITILISLSVGNERLIILFWSGMKIDKKISSRFTINKNFAGNRESWKPLLGTTTYNLENH